MLSYLYGAGVGCSISYLVFFAMLFDHLNRTAQGLNLWLKHKIMTNNERYKRQLLLSASWLGLFHLKRCGRRRRTANSERWDSAKMDTVCRRVENSGIVKSFICCHECKFPIFNKIMLQRYTSRCLILSVFSFYNKVGIAKSLHRWEKNEKTLPHAACHVLWLYLWNLLIPQ